MDVIFGRVSLAKARTLRKYENSYEPQFGFKVAIERLHGLQAGQKNFIHFVVTSLVPPGRLLQATPSMGPDVNVFRDLELENCPWNSLKFKDEMNYVGLAGQEKIGMVFEVKAYEHQRNQITSVKQVGWAFFPLYQALENENATFSLFSNSGLIQMPLFKGAINRKSLVSALKTNDPMIALQRDRDLSYLQPTSIILRVHDNQQKPIAPSLLSPAATQMETSMIPGSQLQVFHFNEKDVANSKEPTLRSLFNLEQESHFRKVKRCFHLDYGFDNPKL